MCGYPGCENVMRVKGLCSAHYAIQSKGEELRTINHYKKRYEGPCLVPNCGDFAISKRFCMRHYRFSIKYHFSPQEMAELPDACEICGSSAKLHVDHDHSTGAYRGILCMHCNHILGKANDDPNRLRLAANYLENRMEF